jgi:hypothetical protein
LGTFSKTTCYQETRCVGPASHGRCRQSAVAHSLCAGHLQQRNRGVELRTLLDVWSGRSCSVPGCDRVVLVKGLCGAHFQQKRSGKRFTKPRPYALGGVCIGPSKTTGKICGLPTQAHQLCRGHYQQRYWHKERRLTPLQNWVSPEVRSFNRAYRQYERKAKKSNQIWELTLDQFMRIVKSVCHYCSSKPRHTVFARGRQKDKMNGVDRKNNEPYYKMKNSLSCCTTCNLMKGSMSYISFLAHVRKIRNKA